MATDHQDIISEIRHLKKQKKAVFLVHNYQRPEVQDLADFVGDSLELSQKAAKTEAEVIVFCGVHFMAETAFLVNPGKTVLLPEMESGCPMADMITVEQLIKKKKEIPGAVVVCYVNSSAAVKAESDICCTSANAVRVVQSLPVDREILFIPDQYLGQWVAQKTGRDMHLWPGYCPTHMRILGKKILEEKAKHPAAIALVHPECRPDAKEAADEVLSTGGMIRFAAESPAKEFIIGTETGIIHRLKKENPGKIFIPVNTKAVCPNMKKITLEKVLRALQKMQYKVSVPRSIRDKALSAVNRMLAVG
ncbi:MAG: quinolinate synthase NadA [Deltaproteobacteria bacterium]|nr:quinolinate synthase NadA [Deltaproteobacteria bacterium]